MTSKAINEAGRALVAELPKDARMDGYYIGFDRTGIGAIDAILSAIAHAGKAFHHTEDWCEEWSRADYLPHGGDTANAAIQNAANAAAQAVIAVIDEYEVALREARKS